jgi:hypothetical protein
MAISPEEQVKQLIVQLQQKDEMISMLKVKARDFVQNMKDEHASVLGKLEASHKEVCNYF